MVALAQPGDILRPLVEHVAHGIDYDSPALFYAALARVAA